MAKVKQIILSFHPCFTAGHQIILGDRRLGPGDRRWIHRSDAIILPQSCPHELYRTCKGSGAQVFPNYDVRFQYPGKMGQSLLFQEFRFPHPGTMRWSSVSEMDEFLRGRGKLSHLFPFLVKANESHEGEGIFEVRDREELKSVLEALAAWERTGQSGFISQQMIQTDGNVLRAVILGKRIITYWKRALERGEPIIGVSRNARIDRDWRGDLQKKARSQARRFLKKTGINLAAIDFVFPFNDPDPDPLFLEVNTYFGRRGFGGSLNYYRILHKAIQGWLEERGFDPGALRLL